MMIILDTNIFSALMRLSPEEKVVAWLDKQPRASIWTTSVTVLEVRFGLRIMPDGKRKSALVDAFAGILSKIENRVLPFDIFAAQQASDLTASRHKKGRPVELRDTMIAGIVIAQQATLATRNTMHFDDIAVPLINPWMI